MDMTDGVMSHNKIPIYIYPKTFVSLMIDEKIEEIKENMKRKVIELTDCENIFKDIPKTGTLWEDF